jgi:hypothetical protein
MVCSSVSGIGNHIKIAPATEKHIKGTKNILAAKKQRDWMAVSFRLA